MNKKLLAVAVAGVLAAPLAQAQTANVTLYGRLNLDANVIINQAQTAQEGPATPVAGAKENIYRVTSNSSRFGIRGTESLGGGLNAIFQLESSINGASSGGTLAGRETFVGLQGGWGTLKLGYFLSPYDDMHGIFGSVPTLLTGILATSAVWSNSGAQTASITNGSFDSRVANSVRYDTPNMAGFTASAQIGARQSSESTAEQRRHAYVVSLNGMYNNGPVQVGLAYEVHNGLRQGLSATAALPNANPKLQDQGFTVTGSYNFGPIKVGAVYERVKYDIATGGDLARNMWGVSGMGNLGPGQYYLGYFRGADGTGSAKCVTSAAGVTTCPRVGAVTLGTQTGVNMYEFSYTYPLSKRTLMYAGYVMISNDNNAAYNFGVNPIMGVCTGNGEACGSAAKPQGITGGIVHFF